MNTMSQHDGCPIYRAGKTHSLNKEAWSGIYFVFALFILCVSTGVLLDIAGVIVYSELVIFALTPNQQIFSYNIASTS